MKLAIFLLALPLCAQQLHVTADLLSRQTTTAIFGKLPKAYAAASIRVCTTSPAPVTVPLGAVEQYVQRPGFTLLPLDAAVLVVAAAQGNSGWGKAKRYGLTAVELAALAATWSRASVSLKDTLDSSALAGAGAISVLSSTIPTHTFLTLSNESLSDPLQLAAGGCSKSAILIVESDSKTPSLDINFSLTGAKP